MTTILILDDNATLLQMLGLILRSKGGYQVLEATTEEEAVSRIECYPGGVDLLVADVCVETRPGRIIASRLAAMCPELRLLFISGYPQDHLVEKGWLQPGDPFLAKPFTPERLMRSVNQVLANAYPTHTMPSGAGRTACAGGAA